MNLLSALFCCLFFIVINGNLQERKANGPETKTSKTFFLGSDKANFFQAYFNCKEGGMDLATINSQQEEEDLSYFLRNVNKTGDGVNGFWLSATNLPDVNSTQYYWLTGGKRAIYTNWRPGEPNNSGGNEHCLHWIAISGTEGWNDYICENKQSYICQNPE